MSTNYVIPNISWNELLEVAKTVCAVKKEKTEGVWRLTAEADFEYHEDKNHKLSSILGVPFDELPSSHDFATVYLHETDDHSWLTGYATSRSNPELVLLKLCDAGDFICFSEHYDEYYELVGGDDNDDSSDDGSVGF